MFLLVKDEKLLIKYNERWSQIGKIIGRKKFDSDPVFNNRYLKAKIKSYNN